MRVDDHQYWPELEPLVKIQTYDRDGGHAHPRHRMEVKEPESTVLRRQLLAMQINCIDCERVMYPVRQRRTKTTSHLYLAVACELSHNMGCCRGRRAHEEYERLIDKLKKRKQNPDPPKLF